MVVNGSGREQRRNGNAVGPLRAVAEDENIVILQHGLGRRDAGVVTRIVIDS